MASLVENTNNGFTEDELRVAEILLQLSLFSHQTRSRPFVCWGAKKKRSSIAGGASSPLRNGKETHVKVEASSPATPLSFSPSDADSKPKRSRRRDFKKKTSKELREMEAALYAQQIQLKHEISKVGNYCNKLKALNLLLKAKQNELGSLQTRYQLDLKQSKSLDLLETPTAEPSSHAFEQNQPSIINHQSIRPDADPTDKIAKNSEFPYREVHPSLASSGLELGLENQCRPVGILDLNLPAKEIASLDFWHLPFHMKNKAAIAAQARKRRIEINRVKSSLIIKQPRFR
ncbi:uncharacterized protein LOC131243485 [Magnolia sinica]|uniref:uncharacterized protein LOC131243485 n=1 Tax=Magnolia sinica TaxID=86752 RepID=UPI0026591FC9|nr:uncharacterized protein LOC131243485 [Magnolia sinica]